MVLMQEGEQVLLGSDAVCERAGISYKRLDSWCRAGLIEGHESGPGYGKPRLFTPEQVERIENMARAVRQAAMVLEGMGFSLPFLVPLSTHSVFEGPK